MLLLRLRLLLLLLLNVNDLDAEVDIDGLIVYAKLESNHSWELSTFSSQKCNLAFF
jgi:hypothetical protein